ncbi:hypothetical protein AAKU55_003149 [Oxalobacteraceae bacterium GrIS 1.11]
MTIRLLCSYDKYLANAIVSIDAATEAGLVAAGQATVSLAGGVPYVAPVAQQPSARATLSFDSNNNVTGVSGLTQRPKSNVFSTCLSGYLDVPIAVVGAPYSVMLQTVLERPFDTVRVGIFNTDTVAIDGMKLAVGSGTTLGPANGLLGLNSGGALVGASPGMIAATWGGAATGSLAASPALSTGAAGLNIGGSKCSLTFCDWTTCPSPDARADGITGFPCFTTTITWPAGVNRTRMQMDGTTSIGWENEGSATVAPYGRPYRVMVAPARDAVANMGFMLASNGQCARSYTDFPPIVIQATSRYGDVETLILFGDSIEDGSAASIQYCNWAHEFQQMMSTPQNPISICNFAVPGSGAADWYNRAASVIGNFSKASVHAPSLTPNALNGPILDSDITNHRKWWGLLRQKFDLPGLMFFTSTVIPTNHAIKAYGVSDAKRIAWNDAMRVSTFRCADFDAVMAGPTDQYGQVTLAPALHDGNGIHPNTPGYKVMARAFIPVWLRY